MNQRLAVLFYPAALAVIAGGFLYAIRSERRSRTMLREIHDRIEHSATRSQATYRLLKRQRRVLQAIADYLLPVPKGVEKPLS